MVSMVAHNDFLNNGDVLTKVLSAATHPKLLNLVPTECQDRSFAR